MYRQWLCVGGARTGVVVDSKTPDDSIGAGVIAVVVVLGEPGSSRFDPTWSTLSSEQKERRSLIRSELYNLLVQRLRIGEILRGAVYRDKLGVPLDLVYYRRLAAYVDDLLAQSADFTNELLMLTDRIEDETGISAAGASSMFWSQPGQMHLRPRLPKNSLPPSNSSQTTPSVDLFVVDDEASPSAVKITRQIRQLIIPLLLITAVVAYVFLILMNRQDVSTAARTAAFVLVSGLYGLGIGIVAARQLQTKRSIYRRFEVSGKRAWEAGKTAYADSAAQRRMQ